MPMMLRSSKCVLYGRNHAELAKGQAHYMFSRFMNLRIFFHENFFVLFFNNAYISVYYVRKDTLKNMAKKKPVRDIKKRFLQFTNFKCCKMSLKAKISLKMFFKVRNKH